MAAANASRGTASSKAASGSSTTRTEQQHKEAVMQKVADLVQVSRTADLPNKVRIDQ